MIFGFVGQIGSGKTLLMSVFAADFFRQGWPVFSNYALTFGDRITTLDELFNLSNGLVVLDEIQTIADSRQFKGNNSVTQWLLQSRKSRLHLFFTTQSISQVDVRFRNQLDFVLLARSVRGVDQRGTRFDVVDWNLQRSVSGGVLWHDKKFYTLYDTYQKVDILV